MAESGENLVGYSGASLLEDSVAPSLRLMMPQSDQRAFMPLARGQLQLPLKYDGPPWLRAGKTLLVTLGHH